MKNIVILISGRGSNLSALLDANIPAHFVAVISNRPDAAGLQYAAERGIKTVVIDHKTFVDRAVFDKSLIQEIDSHKPHLVVLAGFMRIFTPEFVEHYYGRLINIHPSLLPSFTGLHTHEKAIAEGVKIHGCTVHFVNSTLDHGPIVVQAAVPVLKEDTPDILAARVLKQEHIIYPKAVRWFVEGRLKLTDDGKVHLLNELPIQDVLVSPGD